MKRFLQVMQCYLYFKTLVGYDERLLWDEKKKQYWILNSKDKKYNNPNFEIVL